MIDGAGSEYLVAVVLYGDRIYQILDIDALFTVSNRSEGRPSDADRDGFKLLLDRL
jgi:chemotaxis signal transduction protein